jgi:hypothetical protein
MEFGKPYVYSGLTIQVLKQYRPRASFRRKPVVFFKNVNEQGWFHSAG